MSRSTSDETQSDKRAPIDERQLKLEIEWEVMVSDYGASSWMTRSQAEKIGQLLGLESGRRLLDVGAGSGWPGLFLAHTTGCDVALVDKPLEGLRVAAERATMDGLAGECCIVVGDGTALPFRTSWFDAICHSDVLC